MHKATRKYLERHAAPEARSAGETVLPPKETFGHVLVLPVHGEGENLFSTLNSIPEGPRGPILAILVVNGSHTSPAWVHEQNERQIKDLSSFSFSRGRLLVIDCASPGRRLPAKQGVGLARKIGCDIALSLHVQGKIRSRWIHTTDADVILPWDYFEKAEEATDPEISTLLYPFVHVSSEDPLLAEATQLYEIHLRYYVAGLQWANSPYAFHTIGSTLAFRASSYAEGGGFPRRMAGEDFYLLNKLAKLGKVHSLSGTPLQIEGRLSDRVPFGTGKALAKILKDRKQGLPFLTYHPEIFSYLKIWMETLNECALKGNAFDPPLQLKEKTKRDDLKGETFFEILNRMEAFEAIEEAFDRSSEPSVLRRHLHTWFDAFRTLKLIHALRDRAFPSIPLEEALSKAKFHEDPLPINSPWRRDCFYY